LVGPAQLGPAGRRVRCGDCRHVWRQEAPGAESAPPAAPEPAAPATPEPAADSAAEQAAAKAAAEPFAPSAAEGAASQAPEPAEAGAPEEPAPAPPTAAPEAEAARSGERVSRRAFAKPTRPQRAPRRASLALGWAIYAVVVVGLASGFYYGRAPLVAMVPQMTRLYDLVGLKDEAFELGLELRDVKSVRRLVEGERVVVIEGLVVNLSNQDRQVPPLGASVTDAQGTEVDRWTFMAERAQLAPGASTRFETVAKNPPREGNLSIDFVVEN
jgi:hypothetical protein